MVFHKIPAVCNGKIFFYQLKTEAHYKLQAFIKYNAVGAHHTLGQLED